MKQKFLHKREKLHTFALGNKCNNYVKGEKLIYLIKGKDDEVLS